MSLFIAMSVYKLREGTKRSVDELLRVARQNPEVNVVVFNKTGEDFLNDIPPLNFKIVYLAPETFGETISRLEIKDEDYVIWCNDDDFFEFSIDLMKTFDNLDRQSVGLPVMSIETSLESIYVDWSALTDAQLISDRYRAYSQTAAPLIFALIPGSIFSNWINYVKRSVVKFPYLDTQLNLACLTSSSLRCVQSYRYSYGAHNWESTQKMHEATLRWVEELGLAKNAVYTLDLCRAIDDIVFIASFPDLQPEVTKEFLNVLLNQLSFLNDSHRQSLNLSLRGRIFTILYDYLPLVFKRLLVRVYQSYYFRNEPKFKGQVTYRKMLPRHVSDQFSGISRISSIDNFQLFLETVDLHKYLCIPIEQLQHWQAVVSTTTTSD